MRVALVAALLAGLLTIAATPAVATPSLGSWSSTSLGAAQTGVSCPSAGLCVSVGATNAYVNTAPSTGTTWQQQATMRRRRSEGRVVCARQLVLRSGRRFGRGRRELRHRVGQLDGVDGAGQRAHADERLLPVDKLLPRGRLERRRDLQHGLRRELAVRRRRGATRSRRRRARARRCAPRSTRAATSTSRAHRRAAAGTSRPSTRTRT